MPGIELASITKDVASTQTNPSAEDTPLSNRVTSRTRGLVAFSVAFYLLLAIVILISILHKTGGTFVYPLDDPYIHLAMAEQLVHGHYGINTVEASSPSSSILWPLLLIPFAGTSWQVYLPLAWNLLFGLASAGLIGAVVAGWPGGSALATQKTPWWQQAVIATLLILLANLVSLTFIGMEHVLQVMLSLCCAIGMLEAMEGRTMPSWSLAAAIIAPMVRYEDLALTVAVAIGLIGLKQGRKAAIVLAGSVVPLIGFSLFLKAKGLPILPTSVLVKGGAYKTGTSPVMSLLSGIRENVIQDLQHLERASMALLLLILLVLLWRERSRTRRFVIGGAAWVAAIQLLIGRFGWFHRYEVYAFIFVALILVRILAEKPTTFRFALVAFLLLFCARPYILGTLMTPRGSFEVYEQQYQMHRFMTGFYGHDVALNDLGLVSYQRPAGVYVLDLFGLASPEASRQVDKTAPWLDDIVQRHGVHMAMLYPAWFQIPSSWTPLAKLCLDRPHQVVSESCVVFYSTSAPTLEQTRAAVARFARTVPPPAVFSLYPERPAEIEHSPPR
ncbi:hypothetical protein EDE15_1726 [Edaphobacter aggregans]|uniref:Dolichyl-phosphate-mannose-protein mannosyltransferase n=1 Tax=Edaphobacter aggregans TaxID=570835 RepID=A0A3R9NXR7_9BACT|nr:hypothetical protein [Edaphobacter aggregans]RSL16215.1 hypothetical protein EDE15_1726 [Edaphobacter aggregans]